MLRRKTPVGAECYPQRRVTPSVTTRHVLKRSCRHRKNLGAQVFLRHFEAAACPHRPTLFAESVRDGAYSVVDSETRRSVGSAARGLRPRQKSVLTRRTVPLESTAPLNGARDSIAPSSLSCSRVKLEKLPRSRRCETPDLHPFTSRFLSRAKCSTPRKDLSFFEVL